MAKKPKLAKDEKFERHSFDLFGALEAIDKKDYSYYDRLTEEEKRHFSAFGLVQWVSAINGQSKLHVEYLQNTNIRANRYLFNEMVIKHPKLQWLMLCSASPGKGKQFHQWVYQISKSVAFFERPAERGEIEKYFSKVYSKASESYIAEYSDAYVKEQNKKHYIAKSFPHLKIDEIELLSELITDEEIQKHKEDSGNT